MKKFCIAGPINPKDHYYIPHRLNWNELNGLIESKLYFVLHAPRQSGKTTAIREYIRYLLTEEKYIPFYLSLKSAHNKPAVRQTFMTILEQAKREIEKQFQESQLILDQLKDVFEKSSISEISLYDFLSIWSHNAPKPLVIFFDEVDGLQGDALIDFLKQIRTGYPDRPDHFPQSICFIGVRDLRDYKIKTGGKADQLSWVSPFNIKAESILLSNFTLEQIKQLYEQHTQETGQLFTPDAIEYAFYLTQGQPWLVNALAHEACFRDVTDRSQPITKDVIDRAKNKLILRQDTHLDALIDRLKDPRVFPIIDAIISGKEALHFNHDDVHYVRDLGLLAPDKFAIANPIYQEVIPRALVFVTQQTIQQKTAWYIDSSGSLNTQKLLENFTQFFRENSESWLKDVDYKESAPHLLLMAFLQRVINGGGTITREYALGTKRVDLLIIWPTSVVEKKQRIVIELKINYGKNTIAKGLEQTAQYMDTCDATEGHLMIFDRDPNIFWDEKIKDYSEQFQNKIIHVWWL